MRGATAGRYLTALAVGAGLLLVVGPSWRSGYPSPFPDSSSYVDVADHGPFSIDFWFGQRPPTYPLLIWLVGPSARTLVVVQLAVAVAAWGWLLATVWQRLRHRSVAVVAIVLLAGVAAQTRWAFWHTAVLTESLSASLSVAGVAAWWRWFAGPDRFRLVVATALTGAWMLLRDSNAVTWFVATVPALLVLLALERRRSGPRRRSMVAAWSVLIGVAAFSMVGQLGTDRGETSFHNNVGMRWLVDGDMFDWMQQRGMPVSDALLARAGGDAWADGEAFLRAPELDEYRAWADGRGRAAAAASFMVRADWYLGHFWRDLPAYVATDHLAYDTYALSDRLPERPLGAADPVASRAAMVVWLAFTAVAAMVVAAFDRRSRWLIPFLVIPVLADLYLSYVADAVEVGRHLVGPLQRFAVVTVVAVALGVDRLAGDPFDRAGEPEPVEESVGAPS